MNRQDGGGGDDGVLPLCDCGSGINGTWSGGCYGDPFYLGIYGGLGITIGLLSFTKSLTMLKGIIRNGCFSGPTCYRSFLGHFGSFSGYSGAILGRVSYT